VLPVLTALLPVFIVASAGYGLRRLFPIDPRTLATLIIYLFLPCLIFDSFSTKAIDWNLFALIATASLTMVIVMATLLYTTARLRNLHGPDRNALLMTMFMNLGNFGLPVCRFAFGEEGLRLAVIVLVCGSILQNTIAVYLARQHSHGVRGALAQLFRLPIVYAFALAILAQHYHWTPPLILSRAITMAAGAVIPVQLVALGVKLAETRLEISRDVIIATAMRLIVGPMVAVGIAWICAMHGLVAKIFVLQMSGPVAVGMAVYGMQFDIKPTFLASVVSWSFLLSLGTVAVVLYLLYEAPLF